MKVLLINPWQPETFPPPSIGYLQATLKAYGIDVRVMKRNFIYGGANIIWLLPNTEAYKRAKQRVFSDDIYLQSGAPFYEYEHPLKELKQWADMINAA